MRLENPKILENCMFLCYQDCKNKGNEKVVLCSYKYVKTMAYTKREASSMDCEYCNALNMMVSAKDKASLCWNLTGAPSSE